MREGWPNPPCTAPQRPSPALSAAPLYPLLPTTPYCAPHHPIIQCTPWHRQQCPLHTPHSRARGACAREAVAMRACLQRPPTAGLSTRRAGGRPVQACRCRRHCLRTHRFWLAFPGAAHQFCTRSAVRRFAAPRGKHQPPGCARLGRQPQLRRPRTLAPPRMPGC